MEGLSVKTGYKELNDQEKGWFWDIIVASLAAIPDICKLIPGIGGLVSAALGTGIAAKEFRNFRKQYKKLFQEIDRQLEELVPDSMGNYVELLTNSIKKYISNIREQDKQLSYYYVNNKESFFSANLFAYLVQVCRKVFIIMPFSEDDLHHFASKFTNIILNKKNVLLLSNNLEDPVADNIEKTKELDKQVKRIDDDLLSLQNKFELANARRLEEIEYYKQAIDSYCATQLDAVKKQLLFPWAREDDTNPSLTLEKAFPICFIHPRLKDNLTENALCFDDLLTNKYVGRNTIICGDAGSGKSTLLRYLFAFQQLDDMTTIYITASEARNANGILSIIKESCKEDKKKYLVLIDGIDEEFSNCNEQYRSLLSSIKADTSIVFWLGCRTDFYIQNRHKDLYFEKNRLTIQRWTKPQFEHFVRSYSKKRNNEDISTRVFSWKEQKKLDESMFSNPFQLSLIVYLAEDEKQELNIRNIYDLYETFIKEWILRERDRRTTTASNIEIIELLRNIAYGIYSQNYSIISSTVEISLYNNNSAVRNLLIQDHQYQSLEGYIYISAFYHRSIAAFMLANHLIHAFLTSNFSDIEKITTLKLKNDVTDFVQRRFESMDHSEKEKIKLTLFEMYNHQVQDSKNESRIKEQSIYYLTRLGIDVSEFVVEIINSNPTDPYMKLSLAYGCVLSDNPIMRKYALDYAKSLTIENSENARVNRAWTVVYFGDVSGKDPYTYKDDEKCDWTNARNARLTRFTKEKPRLKDYRFWLFDIPLIHSYLKDRDWKDVAQEDFDIISSISIPRGDVFLEEEIDFLTEQKEKLLKDYQEHLEIEKLPNSSQDQ